MRRPLGLGAALAVTSLTLATACAADRVTAAPADLHRAAAAGDVAGIERALGAGVEVDSPAPGGRTALLDAVGANQLGAVKALLDLGASPNAQAEDLDTPWLLAGAEGRTEMLRAMLAHEPDLTVRNRYGGNALIPACERAHVDTVRFLLDNTAIDVDHVNNLGWTCLLEAVILGDGGPDHQAVVRLTLAAGAGPDLADSDGVTPLAHARQRGQNAVAALLEAAGAKP